jgi:HD-GYP domain-containing protein (c-di-GMP phosphodiesterase class II)
MYDALTTTRAYRPAMTHERAMEEIRQCRRWWREDVFEAFRRAVETLVVSAPRAA